jgi:hypothetical protein
MSYLLPHLHSGWAVDQAILSEEGRVVVIRFGHDWDETCMQVRREGLQSMPSGESWKLVSIFGRYLISQVLEVILGLGDSCCLLVYQLQRCYRFRCCDICTHLGAIFSTSLWSRKSVGASATDSILGSVFERMLWSRALRSRACQLCFIAADNCCTLLKTYCLEMEAPTE